MQTEHDTRSVWALALALAVAVGGLFTLAFVDHGLLNGLDPSQLAAAHATVLPSTEEGR
jgi:hypothetical protein